MPIYNPRLTNVDPSETRRYAGLSGQVDFSTSMLFEACTQAQLLATPKGVWRVYPYDQDNHTIVAPNPLTLATDSVIRHLHGAVEVAITAVTIGLVLEQEVSNLFSQGKYTLALLLDAAGTTAVEASCNGVCTLIAQHAARSGLIAGARFSPGYNGWSVEVQPAILALAGGDNIELSVTVSSMLVPRKSVTAIVGLYPYHQTLDLPHHQEMPCEKCGQPDCHARKESKNS